MTGPVSSQAWLTAAGTGLRLQVLVGPNARKSEIIGVQDGALKIKLQAQPVEGKANEALVRFLAERLDLPRKAIELTRGATSRNKTVEIRGIALDAALRLHGHEVLDEPRPRHDGGTERPGEQRMHVRPVTPIVFWVS